MKALLYKDFCVLWKQMKFVVVMAAVFCLTPSAGSFDLGYYFVAYLGLLLPASLLAYDQQARWDSLAAMLPYTSRQIVLSRYVLGWLALAVGSLLCLLGDVLVSGQPLRASAMTLALLTGVVLVMQAFYFPLIFRLGSEKGRTVMLVTLVVLLAICAALFNEFDGSVWSNARDLLALVFLVPAIPLSLLSVNIAQRQYEKRAW